MKAIKLLFYSIPLLLMALLCSKCDKDNCKGYYSYSFNTNGLAIYPAADSIRLGHAIWVVVFPYRIGNIYCTMLAPKLQASKTSIEVGEGSGKLTIRPSRKDF